MADEYDTTRAGGLTRRRLIQAGAGGAVLACLGGAGPVAALGRRSKGLRHLRRSTYKGLSSSTFRVGHTKLRLTSVSDLPAASRVRSLRGSEDAFSLQFRAPRGTSLGPDAVRLRHPELGAFTLFLSPVGRSRLRQHYEAVIDRVPR